MAGTAVIILAGMICVTRIRPTAQVTNNVDSSRGDGNGNNQQILV